MAATPKETAAVTVKFVQLALDDLIDVGDNIRTDLGDLTELAASLKQQGMMQPIVVDGDQRIVSGHRRYAAARLAGLDQVPVLVNEGIDEVTRLEMMIVENLQRANLPALDEAAAFRRLTDLGHTQRRIAERVGCAQAHVSRRLSLLDLPAEARPHIESGAITLDDATVLARASAVDLGPDLAKLLNATKPEQWQVASLVDRIRRSEAAAKLRKQALASGKPELDRVNWDRFAQVGSADAATHWCLTGTTLLWLNELPADPNAGPDDAAVDDYMAPRDTARISDPVRDAEAEERRQAFVRRRAVNEALTHAAADRKSFAKAWLGIPKNWLAGAKNRAAIDHVVLMLAQLATVEEMYADPAEVAELIGLTDEDGNGDVEALEALDITTPEDRLLVALATARVMGENGCGWYGKDAGGHHLLFLAQLGRPVQPVEQLAIIDRVRQDDIDLEAAS